MAAASRRSFPHRDFENPDAETCWLSCLFQSLWHSAVFHAAFEEHVAFPKYIAQEDETVLAALQKTWADYKAKGADPDGKITETETLASAEAPSSSSTQAERQQALVPADDLAAAFGAGYGDMSDGFAMIREELLSSVCFGAIQLAEQMMLVPMVATFDCPTPTPALAWARAEEWQGAAMPLIAVDLSVEAPTRESSVQLAKEWIPRSGAATIGDLGPQHRLVSLVCYMWDVQHYVAFCRRQRDAERCIFFNDLPELTEGTLGEYAWCDVPALCEKHFLTPRLALYEHRGAAGQAQS
jgi:hypothetical protein